MTVNVAGGSRFSIGTTLAIDFDSGDAAALADFLSDSYVDVGEVEDLGEFGDASEEVPFTALADDRTRKLKGPRDAGTMSVVCGADTNDQGQELMDTAEGEKTLEYNFRVEAEDKITVAGTNSFRYFRGKVMSKRETFGAANNVVRVTFNVGVNSKIIKVAAT